jgi:hypothetical protein
MRQLALWVPSPDDGLMVDGPLGTERFRAEKLGMRSR